MADSSLRPATPSCLSPDADPLLSSLPAEQAAAVRQLVRERDHLVLLHESIVEVARATTLEARLRIIVAAIQRTGFRRVAITLRDAELNATMLVTAGLTAAEEAELRAAPASGVTWQRRFASLERFRISQSYYLDARDEWIAREFRGGVPSRLEPGDDPDWSPHDSLLVPLRASDGRILATLVLDEPTDRTRPSLARVRTVELFGQQVAFSIEQASLVDLAQHRAERLQRLQEAGSALARLLDADEIVRELARQVQRVMRADGVVVAYPDVEARTIVARLRLVHGRERPRAPVPLGSGPIAEVARTGRTVRVADYEANGGPFAASDDVVGDARPAGSLLVVPMLTGIRLAGVLAVHAAPAGVYTAEDEEVLRTIASQAATALANADLYAESQRERRQSEALANIARAVGGSLHEDEVLRLILRHATALLRSEGATVSLRKEDELEIVAGAGTGEGLRGMRLPLHGSLSGRVLRNSAAEILNDLDEEPEAYGPTQEKAAIRKVALAPLTVAGGAIGVISVFNRAADFDETDARVLQRLADQVAVAIANARLFEEAADATREWHSLAERHHRLLETVSDAIVITDLDRRIAYTNRAGLDLFGAPDDLVGVAVSELVPAELRALVRAHEDKAMAGAPQRYETMLLRMDGDRRLVSVSTAPLRVAGQVTGVVASLRDITDERRARDAVIQSEARYRNLFETASDAIYTLDVHGAFTSANDATSRLTGIPREELLGRSMQPLLPPGDMEHVTAHFRAALGGESRRYECWMLPRDGQQRLVSVTNTPIRQGDRVIGVLAIGRDITEDRRRAEALERSEARYTRLVESASDAIFTVDHRGTFTAVNRALELATGRSRDSLYGVRFTEVLDPDDREPMWALFEATLQGERQRGELHYLGRDGSSRTGSVVTAPVVEQGRVTGGLAIVRDITDEKRLTEQLLQQEKLAAIGQLVSGVAHELNNPLASVAAFSQLLLAAPGMTSEQQASLETIHQEARRAARIVSNLLTFARQHQPERRETDLNQVLLDTIELRRYALRVRQIELEVTLDAQLPVTWADPFQLQQVFLNLLGNAEQALTEWSGTRRIVCRTQREGDHLVVSISDTGAGIAGEHASRIFNPFFTTKPVGQGTGLGLSISDGIVREHGGRLRVLSSAGQGATLVVELPLIEPPPVERAAGPVAPRRRPQGLAILVVDDEPAIRSALTSYLASAGHQPLAADTGRAALDLIAQQQFDAILLDLRMPDLPGDVLYGELQTRDPAQAARVIFLTGDVQSESARAFVQATGRPCLSKPFMLDELAATLAGEAPVSWPRF